MSVNECIFNTAEKVAPFLSGWRLDRRQIEGHTWPRFRHNDTGAEFSFIRYSTDKMVRVLGCGVSINFSPERTGHAIAVDIRKRFIPEFLLKFNEAQARKRAEQADARDWEIKEAMIHRMGFTQYLHHRRDRAYVSPRNDEVATYYQGDFQLTLKGLSLEEIHKALAAVGRLELGSH